MFMQQKFTVILLLLAASFASYAQTSQGTVALGGGFQFSAYKEQETGTDSRYTSFSFSPEAGYFVIDHLMLGLALNVSTQNSEPSGGLHSKTNSFGIGPFARYYIFTSNEKFAFMADGRFGFSATKYKPETGNDTKGSTVNFSVSPGFTFFPTQRWGFEFTLGLLSISSRDPDKDNDNDKQTSFNFGFNSFNAGLGVRYYISK